jgi:signal transduction histidine kinase
LLCLSYHDNGIGFNLNEELKGGLGLKNFESRTRLLNARFKMKSQVGNGTSAILCLNTKADNSKA